MDKINYLTDPHILFTIKTIKAIQQRMKDDDNVNLEYIEIFDKLAKEFQFFSDQYTDIFTKVIRGESLKILAAALYYKDKVSKGKMTESQLSELLAQKFLPKDLKEISDAKLREMK